MRQVRVAKMNESELSMKCRNESDDVKSVLSKRYADDVVIHCKSLAQATMLHDKLLQRLAECKLELSPSKTKIVYCKDRERAQEHKEISFDFLGYTFRPRKSVSKDGDVSLNFLPAISGKAAKAIRQTVRDWNLKRKVRISLEEIARRIKPVVRGWMVYYGRFYRSALCRVVAQVDLHPVSYTHLTL